jgi:alanine racemase
MVADMANSDMPMRCWAEIDLGALAHNAGVASAGGAGVIAIIKADAYGHGMVAVSAALESRVDAFGVASVEEGMCLRSAGCRKPVLVLGAVAPDLFPCLLQNSLQASISNLAEAKLLDALAGQAGQKAPVHLVFDTGMGRIGFLHTAEIESLRALPNLEVIGVASHYPSADEDEHFTLEQTKRFSELVASLDFVPGWVHIANSAAILGFPADATKLVRAGLMIYGSSPLAEHQAELRPALTWKSRITLLRDLPPGHGISYGRTFLTEREPFTRVATIGVGYGDGYPLSLSGQRTEVLVRGQRCPLLGRVTMDQIMVDVTALGDVVVPGDEVVLIGSQGAETILAAELAERAGTIAWEIFTRITPRVRRVYVH